MPETVQFITGMEVLDTAVKIGLGALISGLATYWVTKLNHDKDIEKQVIRRKRELLENIAGNVEHFWNAFRRYFLVSLEGIKQARENEQIPASIFDEYIARQREVMDATNELSTAQSSLLLLGENVATQTLLDLAKKTEKYMRATRSLDVATEIQALQEMHSDIIDTREQFYASLSSAYKQNLL